MPRPEESMTLVELDTRKRASLARLAKHRRYIVTVDEDGVITMTPAVVRSEIEDRIRATPGLADMIDEIAKRPASDFRTYERRPRR